MKKAVIVFVILCIQASVVVSGQPQCPIPPAEGSSAVIILRVEYAATALNDEYIVILNRGDTTVDLSGWVVFNTYYEMYRNLPAVQRVDKFAWRNVYRIPTGIKLPPRHWVKIFSGFGESNEMYLYRNLTEQWLDNQSDTVYLMDNFCNIIHMYSWP